MEKNPVKVEEKKDLCFAELVHDIKNPLNAQIIALEQLYKEKFGGLNMLQKEILNDVISSSKFMREMLSSVLSIYKLENGNMILNKSKVNIDELIKICIKDLTFLADEKLIYIEYLNSALNYVILCDENYIRRVILNMINNIILYSYKQSKALILVENNSEYLSLHFKNTGFPIEENLKLHIFEKYNTGAKSGTGLGLYFCKKAVEAHNGTIELHSNNSDIEFIIKLPV